MVRSISIPHRKNKRQTFQSVQHLPPISWCMQCHVQVNFLAFREIISFLNISRISLSWKLLPVAPGILSFQCFNLIVCQKFPTIFASLFLLPTFETGIIQNLSACCIFRKLYHFYNPLLSVAGVHSRTIYMTAWALRLSTPGAANIIGISETPKRSYTIKIPCHCHFSSLRHPFLWKPFCGQSHMRLILLPSL